LKNFKLQLLIRIIAQKSLLDTISKHLGLQHVSRE
jgi:hypothetical protein